MGSVFVKLTEESSERLKTLAREERRRPGDQAALILERALREGKARTDDSESERAHG
jgi:hypothetical protein